GHPVVERPIQMRQRHVHQHSSDRPLFGRPPAAASPAGPSTVPRSPAPRGSLTVREFPQWARGRVGQLPVRTALTASQTEAASRDFAPSGIWRSNPSEESSQPALSSTSNALPSPTLLTTSRSHPLCSSLTRP